MNAEPFTNCPRCGEPVLASALEAHAEYCDGTARHAQNETRGWLWAYVVSFLLPVFGLGMGLYLYAQDDAEKRGAGTTCLLLAALGVVWTVVVWVYIIPALQAPP